jgi:hypothetical protein
MANIWCTTTVQSLENTRAEKFIKMSKMNTVDNARQTTMYLYSHVQAEWDEMGLEARRKAGNLNI